MKQLKFYVIIILLSILIIPSVALAAWWNPFSWNWNIFDIFSKSNISITYPVNKPTVCTPEWMCIWGPCVNGSQSQVASDYNNCGGAQSGQIACPTLARLCNPSTEPSITSIYKTSGLVGDSVTITGTNFNPLKNYVLFNNLVASRVLSSSSNKTSLTFIVPSSLSPQCNLFVIGQACPQFVLRVGPAIYSVAVETANGTSNSLSFTVSSSNSGAPTITSISANSGLIGATETITGTGFTSTGNTVYIGGSQINNLSSNGTTLSFIIPNPSDISGSSGAGNYSLFVSNTNGTSNSLSFAVTARVNSAQPSITSIYPTSGPIGTQVTITGYNFTTTGNSVNFGFFTISNLNSSNNGTQIIFSVPAKAGTAVCTDLIPGTCSITPTTLGLHQIQVNNSQGVGVKSNFTFTVTSN